MPIELKTLYRLNGEEMIVDDVLPVWSETLTAYINNNKSEVDQAALRLFCGDHIRCGLKMLFCYIGQQIIEKIAEGPGNFEQTSKQKKPDGWNVRVRSYEGIEGKKVSVDIDASYDESDLMLHDEPAEYLDLSIPLSQRIFPEKPNMSLIIISLESEMFHSHIQRGLKNFAEQLLI